MKIEYYTKYYIQNSDHYLIPKDVFIELFNEMVNWREENKKQKEVIDKAIEYIESNSDIYLNIMGNKVGFFINHNDGHVPVELLDILKGEQNER